MAELDNVKAIFVDIDGTLCNSRGIITLKTRKSIKRLVDKGIFVVITSGRNCKYAVDKSIRALASNIVISSNGAEIYDYEVGKLLYSNKISNDKLKKIWDFCNNNFIGLLFNSGFNRYMNKYLIGSLANETSLVTDFDELVKMDISQLVVISNDYNKTLKVSEFIESLGLGIGNFSKSFLEKTSDDLFSIDIVNKDVSKGVGILKLLEILNIDRENTLCFGDYINDFEMFEVCKYKVAMGNACESLKKKADFITLSNDDNGIAYFLNKYL